MAKTKKASAKPKGKTKEQEQEFYDQLAGNQGGAGGGKFWKPTGGTDVVRLIPFEHDGKPFLGVQEITHFGLTGNPNIGFTCPRTHGEDKEDCPICALEDELPSKQWGRIKPSSKALVNLIVRSSEGDEFVKARLPMTVYYDMRNYVMGREEYGDRAAVEKIPNCVHESKGRDFVIKTNGKQKLERRYITTPKDKVSSWGMKVEPIDLVAKIRPALDTDKLQAMADKLKER